MAAASATFCRFTLSRKSNPTSVARATKPIRQKRATAVKMRACPRSRFLVPAVFMVSSHNYFPARDDLGSARQHHDREALHTLSPVQRWSQAMDLLRIPLWLADGRVRV